MLAFSSANKPPLNGISKMTELERQSARIEAERAQLRAAAVRAGGRIAEIELQIIQIDRDFTAEVAKELADKIPDKLKALSAACDQYAQDVGVMPAE